MSEVLMSGGAGGIDSSDVTAAKSDVLEGKSTITSDSNDEVVQGTMPLLTSNSDLLNVMLAHQRTDQLGMGKFIDSPSLGRGLMVALRPEDGKKYAVDNRTAFVFIPLPDLKAENIRADKNIAQVQGNMPVIGKTGVAQGQVFLQMVMCFSITSQQESMRLKAKVGHRKPPHQLKKYVQV